MIVCVALVYANLYRFLLSAYFCIAERDPITNQAGLGFH